MFIKSNDKLSAEFVFEDFKKAFGFMSKVAIEAEAQGHHPSWSNIYNKVWIELSTHDAGNVITQKDQKLAATIEQIFKEM